MRRMHDKVVSSSTGFGPKCFEPKKMHTVCYNCGTYNDTQVLDLDKKEKSN